VTDVHVDPAVARNRDTVIAFQARSMSCGEAAQGPGVASHFDDT